MRKICAIGLLVCLILSISSAATVRVQGIDLDFVTIGNAGNAADTTGFGAVDYNYQIGKYEITNGQWDAFVSTAGAPTGNLINDHNPYDVSAYWTGSNVPTNMVSWYEATQFCNFLTSGDKSKGAYLFSGSNSNPGYFLGVDRDSAISTYGTIYVLPTEDEWYKAAYYTGNGYSLYANGTVTAPTQAGWNFYDNGYATDPYGPWDVGTGTEEQNGTYDMMGNVFEWNETKVGSGRGLRGGSYYYLFDDSYLSSSGRVTSNPYYEYQDKGFRVAAIPEPATCCLLSLGTLALLRKRK